MTTETTAKIVALLGENIGSFEPDVTRANRVIADGEALILHRALVDFRSGQGDRVVDRAYAYRVAVRRGRTIKCGLVIDLKSVRSGTPNWVNRQVFANPEPLDQFECEDAEYVTV